MKMSESASKIAGIQLGEATLNLIRSGDVPIRAKFVLITKEGDAAGFIDVTNAWSDKTLEALRVFSQALEEDAMVRLFDVQPSETPEKKEGDPEPKQF